MTREQQYYYIGGVFGAILALVFVGFISYMHDEHTKVWSCYDKGGVLVQAEPYDICIPRHPSIKVDH